MPARVVLFDPDGTLPSSFASDAGLDDEIVQLDRAADVQRIGREASALVLAPGHDGSTAMGFLASSSELSAPLVLYAASAPRHRRVVIRAARRGATILIGQTPSVLSACLRDLLVPRPVPTDAEQACRALAAGLSPPTLALLLLAVDRASPDARARDIALALGISCRTLSRRIRHTELHSVTELVMLGRLMRAMTLTGTDETPDVQARAGGFRSVRALERARSLLLTDAHPDDAPTPMAGLRYTLAHGVTSLH